MNINKDLLKLFIKFILVILFVVVLMDIKEMTSEKGWSVLVINLFLTAIVLLSMYFIRKTVLLNDYKKSSQKENEKLQYQMKSYRSLESSKYEIEKNSHRLMRIVALMENETLRNPQLIEELTKIKVNLKEEGYYINTGNVVFDYLITNKIKTAFDFSSFKSVIAISKQDKYDQKDFIEIIESLIDLHIGCVSVEMNLFEKSSFIICDICHNGKGQPMYEKWMCSFPNYDCELMVDEADRQHFRVII